MVDDSPRFREFIHFFDHKLIQGFLEATYPETDPYLFADWPSVKRDYYKMSGIDSEARLHALLQSYFPELGIHVRRGSFDDSTDEFGARPGLSSLDGSAVLGRTYSSQLEGFRVELVVEEQWDLRGRRWVDRVRERLARDVAPQLQHLRMALSVKLVVIWHGTYASTQRTRDLGDNPLLSDEARQAMSERRDFDGAAHRIPIFRGFCHNLGADVSARLAESARSEEEHVPA